ncbi:hypothetical protein NMY22_g7450 [Coprinellus aureogranulatus]|nr:hypothetical protein NMY22_g7450 [Coprinellus aureogranulatus]
MGSGFRCPSRRIHSHGDCSGFLLGFLVTGMIAVVALRSLVQMPSCSHSGADICSGIAEIIGNLSGRALLSQRRRPRSQTGHGSSACFSVRSLLSSPLSLRVDNYTWRPVSATFNPASQAKKLPLDTRIPSSCPRSVWRSVAIALKWQEGYSPSASFVLWLSPSFQRSSVISPPEMNLELTCILSTRNIEGGTGDLIMPRNRTMTYVGWPVFFSLVPGAVGTTQ